MLVEEVFVQLDRDARGRSARVGPFFISVSAVGIAPPPSSTAFYFGVGGWNRAATVPAKLTSFLNALKLFVSFKLIFQARKIQNRSTGNYDSY